CPRLWSRLPFGLPDRISRHADRVARARWGGGRGGRAGLLAELPEGHCRGRRQGGHRAVSWTAPRRPRAAGRGTEDPRLRDGVRRRSCDRRPRSEEHTSELQSRVDLVCRLLLEKKKENN